MKNVRKIKNVNSEVIASEGSEVVIDTAPRLFGIRIVKATAELIKQKDEAISEEVNKINLNIDNISEVLCEEVAFDNNSLKLPTVAMKASKALDNYSLYGNLKIEKDKDGNVINKEQEVKNEQASVLAGKLSDLALIIKDNKGYQKQLLLNKLEKFTI
jgi:hypothetical protein